MPLKDVPRSLRRHPVSIEVRRHKYGVGAKSFSAQRRHCRMDAEPTCFIRSCAHDRAFALPGDDNRTATKTRIVSLLNRCIERVHIYVGDLARSEIRGFRLLFMQGIFCPCSDRQRIVIRHEGILSYSPYLRLGAGSNLLSISRLGEMRSVVQTPFSRSRFRQLIFIPCGAGQS